MSIKVDVSPSDENQDVPHAQLEIGKSALIITFIWACSALPSAFGGFFYYKHIFQPFQSQIAQFWPIFNNWQVLGIVGLSGLVVWILYLLRILFVAINSKICLIICNKISPPVEMVGATGIGSKEVTQVNIYHLRGTILRILKWVTSKSVFPWLTTWVFNFVGSNKFGKGTVIEDQFICQEFLETGENVYIGQGSQVSSHLVEGKYGAITLKRVKIGDHAIIGAYDLISPGVDIGDYAEIAPMSALTKFQRLKGYRKYYGLPVYRISRKHYMQIHDIPENHEQCLLKTKNLNPKYSKSPSSK